MCSVARNKHGSQSVARKNPTTHSNGRRVLAADIGGTNSRFALFEGKAEEKAMPVQASLSLVRKITFPTQQSHSASELIQTLVASRGDDGGRFMPDCEEERPVFAVLAVPGPASMADPASPPPSDTVCHCPNIPWRIAQVEVSEALGGMPVRLINDFVAQGFAAALQPGLLDAAPVLPGIAREGFPTAIIGAGTGLGHCVVLPGAIAKVMGAEAGHCQFPFEGKAERDYARFLAEGRGTNRLTNEMVVSGSGLVFLYCYLTGEKLHTHEAPAKSALHPVVLEWIARFYGRVCRHYTLNTLSLGGIYITGGLAANLPKLLEHPAFAEELRKEPAMARMLEGIPVWHIRNQDAGLVGAAAYASLALDQNIRSRE